MSENPAGHLALKSLRREWAVYAGLSAVATAAGFLVLRTNWSAALALRWLIGSLIVLVYLYGSLLRQLDKNRLKSTVDAPLLPSFGLANGITISRSVLVAWTAGFLLGPWPNGYLGWVPGMLFLAMVLMDYLDGLAARAAGRITYLGEQLDMDWDCIGVLFAAILLARYGQVPAIYVLVGLARYLYLFGLWLHTRQGGIVGELPPSRYRRILGGMQMGFIAVALLPIFAPPITQIAAVLFMIPVLLSFTRDFLSVTGVLSHLPEAGNISCR